VRQHNLIFVGMLLGAGLGLLLPRDAAAVWWLDLLGTTVFIGALKMIVAPLILFSILAGITSLADKAELWSIGWRTFALYLLATSVAVTIGLFFVLTIRPGERGQREEIRASWGERRAEIVKGDAREAKVAAALKLTPGEAIRENLQQIIANPFHALATANSLGIIFFAILLGVALIAAGEAARPVLPVIEALNGAMLRITRSIMWGSPLFVFCLVASLVAKHGAAVFQTLFWYVLTVLVGIACHVVFLLGFVRVAGKMSPITFLKGMRRAWAVAFATRSSAATLPVTMECIERELKVPRKIVDFVAPIGCTVGMTGTALYEGVAIIFLIQLFGGLPGAEIQLGAVTTVIVFVTAVLAAVGAAAIPDAGLVTMVLVANAVGLDARYIALIFAVDAFLDMFRTSTNVMDDGVVSVAVARYVGATPS
jgi:Na+/H+-dicarboxylate symporter